MNACTLTAPPCPSWCAEHRDGGDAALIDTSATGVIEDFADRDGFLGDPPTTLHVRVEQFEGFDPATRRVYREGAEIVVDDVRPNGIHLVIGSASDARRLSDALTAAADVLAPAEGQDESRAHATAAG